MTISACLHCAGCWRYNEEQTRWLCSSLEMTSREGDRQKASRRRYHGSWVLQGNSQGRYCSPVKVPSLGRVGRQGLPGEGVSDSHAISEHSLPGPRLPHFTFFPQWLAAEQVKSQTVCGRDGTGHAKYVCFRNQFKGVFLFKIKSTYKSQKLQLVQKWPLYIPSRNHFSKMTRGILPINPQFCFQLMQTYNIPSCY